MVRHSSLFFMHSLSFLHSCVSRALVVEKMGPITLHHQPDCVPVPAEGVLHLAGVLVLVRLLHVPDREHGGDGGGGGRRGLQGVAAEGVVSEKVQTVLEIKIMFHFCVKIFWVLV